MPNHWLLTIVENSHWLWSTVWFIYGVNGFWCSPFLFLKHFWHCKNRESQVPTSDHGFPHVNGKNISSHKFSIYGYPRQGKLAAITKIFFSFKLKPCCAEHPVGMLLQGQTDMCTMSWWRRWCYPSKVSYSDHLRSVPPRGSSLASTASRQPEDSGPWKGFNQTLHVPEWAMCNTSNQINTR